MENRFQLIREAVEARRAFLDDHPELVPYQREIDAVLMKAGPNPHNRLVMLEDMLFEKRAELGTAVADLQDALESFRGQLVASE